jgi:hypothetical protein
MPGVCHDNSVRRSTHVHVQVRRMGNPMMAQAASAQLQDPEYRCLPLGSLALRMQTASSSAHRSVQRSMQRSSMSPLRCSFRTPQAHGCAVLQLKPLPRPDALPLTFENSVPAAGRRWRS